MGYEWKGVRYNGRGSLLDTASKICEPAQDSSQAGYLFWTTVTGCHEPPTLSHGTEGPGGIAPQEAVFPCGEKGAARPVVPQGQVDDLVVLGTQHRLPLVAILQTQLEALDQSVQDVLSEWQLWRTPEQPYTSKGIASHFTDSIIHVT